MVDIADDVAWTSDELRVVALDLGRPGATPYVLEASAAAIWHEIAAAGPLQAEELLSRLAEAFDVETAQIRGDVESLLAELRTRRLLSD